MPTTTASYTTLPGTLGGPLSMRRGAVSSFFVSDQQGNTRQLTDSSQAVTDTLTTDAWGKEVASAGGTVNPYKSFGQWGYYKDAANRQYVRARHLRNDLGRWVSRDPIFALAVYSYVSGRVNYEIDPSGLQGEDCNRFPKVISAINKMCSMLRKDMPIPKDKIDAINRCIERSTKTQTIPPRTLIDCKFTRPDGTTLSNQIDAGFTTCLAETCGKERGLLLSCNDKVACGATDPTQIGCGLTLPPDGEKRKKCVMYLCPDNIENGVPIPGTKSSCNDPYGDPSIDPYEFTFLHELMHCCGLGHGGVPESCGQRKPDRGKECNDIYACCVYNILLDRKGPGGSPAWLQCTKHYK